MSAKATTPASNGITLLLEFPFKDHAGSQMAAALHTLMKELPPGSTSFSAWLATTAPIATCYIAGGPGAGAPGKSVLDELRCTVSAHLSAIAAGSIELSRLRHVASHAGSSQDAIANFHYVVRTDVAAGGDDELQRWYAEEHMPMLAAVPGTVRASRFVSLDARPRYYACYDLIDPQVIVSEAWLKVRRTPWSECVRPTFRNTRRVIFRKLNLA